MYRLGEILLNKLSETSHNTNNAPGKAGCRQLAVGNPPATGNNHLAATNPAEYPDPA